MLVLSRHPGERIVIGDSITITLVEVRGDKARIGIDAPPDVIVDREEISARRKRAPDEFRDRRRSGAAVQP